MDGDRCEEAVGGLGRACSLLRKDWARIARKWKPPCRQERQTLVLETPVQHLCAAADMTAAYTE